MRARWQGTCLTRSLGQPSRPPYYSFVCPYCSVLHWQKGRNTSRGVQILGCHCLDVLPHLVACPPCPLVGNGRGGQPDRTEQMPLLSSDPVSSLLSRCWAALARCEQMPKSTNKILGLSCVWAGFDQDQKPDSSPQPPLHLYHQKGLLSRDPITIFYWNSTQVCMHKQVWFSLRNFLCTSLSLHKQF